MGKRRDPKKYKLTFGDGDYEGLSLTLRSVTIREMRELQSADDDESEGASLQRLCSLIAAHMVEWNREDEQGAPLPPSLESLEDEEPGLIHLIIAEWTQAIAGVPAPLDDGSNSGGISPVESVLTEIPSESLAS